MTTVPRLGLGQLLLALDRTMVSLVKAPRGLDTPIGSVALLDSDDVRLGLAASARNADVFFLLGVSDGDALRWLEGIARAPVALFVKNPSSRLVGRAVSAGAAVVTVDPRARWERLYRLVTHAIDHHVVGRAAHEDPHVDAGTDLFGLAQSVAERTRGMVSIEDAQSHVLAYSASNDEADELRRLSILGRAGPPEHLAWINKRGIFDALRGTRDVVRVAERPELGLRPRLAVGIHRPGAKRAAPGFAGTIWLQQGARPLAEDVEQILRGAAVLAERIMSRLAATPSSHALRVQELLGLVQNDGSPTDIAGVARELGVVADGRAALIGFRCVGGQVPASAIALSASAFRHDAQVVPVADRVYVLFPKTGAQAALTSWVRGTAAALEREVGVALRAVIAAPVTGLGAAAAARADVDRVFDSADRHPGVIPAVTSLDEARTTVVLDEIVALVAARDELVDRRLLMLRDHDAEQNGVLVETLGVYLDAFGDVAAAGQRLHVHPNTVRYRVRRIEEVLGSSLNDPDDRLVLGLGLRALSLGGGAAGATPPAPQPPDGPPQRRSARRSR